MSSMRTCVGSGSDDKAAQPPSNSTPANIGTRRRSGAAMEMRRRVASQDFSESCPALVRRYRISTRRFCDQAESSSPVHRGALFAEAHGRLAADSPTPCSISARRIGLRTAFAEADVVLARSRARPYGLQDVLLTAGVADQILRMRRDDRLDLRGCAVHRLSKAK